MQTGEKLYSLFAILFLFMISGILIMKPEYRQLHILLPVTMIGLIVNIVFMFIVLRDIFLRKFDSTGRKFLWVVLILVFWPSVLIYLPKHGFKARNNLS